MATITQRLAFLVSANADGAIKAFEKTGKEAEKSLGKATRNIDALGAKMTKFGAVGLAAAGSLAALGTKFALAGERAATSNARIEQINQSMGLFGNEADKVSKRLIKYAEATARATGIDQNAIKATQAKLLTFKELAATANQVGGAFDRATQAAIDLAAAGFGEATQNATQLGKALNDPIKGLTALARSGVTFTAAEKEKIKALVESGKMLEAQDTLLRAIETQVGGTAAATSNASDRMKVAFSQFQESIGQSLLPIFEDVTKKLTGLFAGFQRLNEATNGALVKFAAFATVGLGAVSAMSLLGGQLIKLRNTLFLVDAATGKMTMRLTTMSKMMIGVTAAITAAVVVYTAYSNKKREVEERTRSLAEALRLEGEAQKDAVAQLVAGDKRTRQYADTLSNLGLTFTDLEKAAAGQATGFDAVRKQLDLYTKRGQFTVDRARELGKAIGYQGDVTVGTVNKIADLVGEIDRLSAANVYAADTSRITADALGDLGDAAAKEAGVRDRLAQEFRASASDKRRFEEQFAIAVEKTTKATGGSSRATKENTEATRKANEAKKKFAERVETAAQAVRDKLNTALDESKNKLKQATDQYNTYMAGVSSAISGTINFGSAQATATANAEAFAKAQQAVIEAQAEYNLLRGSADVDKATDAYKKLTDAQKVLAAEAGKPTGFLGVLRDQAKAAQQFGTNIDRLLAAGLNQAAIDQILSAGADAGNQIADQILSGADPSAKVDEINNLVKSTQDIADRVAKATADKFYAAGVAQATALVEGMQAVFDVWEPVLSEDAVKGLLNPLKSIADYGSQVDAAVASATVGVMPVAPKVGKRKKKIPKLADGGIVQSEPGGRLVLLGEGGRDEAVIPLPAGGGMGGAAPVYNITVQAGLGADGTQIGKEIVDVLVQYQRRVGALPLKVV